MSQALVVIHGTIRPDGTLELDQKPGLPPGRVRVTLEVQPDQPKEDTWTVLQRIRQEQSTRGEKGRTREEIDAGLNALRDEWEDRLKELERIHEEARRARENPGC